MYNSRENLQKDATVLVSIIVALLMLLFVTGSASAQIKLGGKLKSVAAKALPAAVSPSAGGGGRTERPSRLWRRSRRRESR